MCYDVGIEFSAFLHQSLFPVVWFLQRAMQFLVLNSKFLQTPVPHEFLENLKEFCISWQTSLRGPVLRLKKKKTLDRLQMDFSKIVNLLEVSLQGFKCTVIDGSFAILAEFFLLLKKKYFQFLRPALNESWLKDLDLYRLYILRNSSTEKDFLNSLCISFCWQSLQTCMGKAVGLDLHLRLLTTNTSWYLFSLRTSDIVRVFQKVNFKNFDLHVSLVWSVATEAKWWGKSQRDGKEF